MGIVSLFLGRSAAEWVAIEDERDNLREELIRLRDMARQQHGMLSRYDMAPDIGKMLRDLHATLLRGER